MVEKKTEVKKERLMRTAVQHYFDGERHREYEIQVPVDATAAEIKGISRLAFQEKIGKK